MQVRNRFPYTSTNIYLGFQLMLHVAVIKVVGHLAPLIILINDFGERTSKRVHLHAEVSCTLMLLFPRV